MPVQFLIPSIDTRGFTVPDKEVLVSFGSPDDAAAFAEWLDNDGRGAFARWLAASCQPAGGEQHEGDPAQQPAG